MYILDLNNYHICVVVICSKIVWLAPNDEVRMYNNKIRINCFVVKLSG